MGAPFTTAPSSCRHCRTRSLSAARPQAAEARLRGMRVHVGQGRLREGVLVVNPLALAERDLATLGKALRAACR